MQSPGLRELRTVQLPVQRPVVHSTALPFPMYDVPHVHFWRAVLTTICIILEIPGTACIIAFCPHNFLSAAPVR